jgi:diphthine synthase
LKKEIKIILADRELMETGCDELIVEKAKTQNVGVLIVGDPFGATTHADIMIRAQGFGIKVGVVHNASIMNAIGICGLQLYRFGQTISIVFFTETWKPDSFYDKLKQNTDMDLHTLCLLDIKVKEQSEENLKRGKLIYEPPRYMTINTAIDQLFEIEAKRKGGVITLETLAMGVARIGAEDQQIIAGTLKELQTTDFGGPLHSLVICAKLHILEQEIFDYYHKIK